MSGFAHDVAGGSGNLVATSVQSPDYQAGTEGWQIRKDGSAEFNDLVIRGEFDGNDFILSAAGFFIYSGVPAAGNLLFSVTPASTSADSEGNAIPNDGATSYSNDGSFWSAVNIGDGVISWYKATSEAGPWTSEAGIGFEWNSLTGGGLNFSAPAGSDMAGDLNVTGSITASVTLTVAGTDVGATLAAIIAALSGQPTTTNGLTDGTVAGTSATAGLTNGQITGTSGGASAGTAHTHGAGSYAVTNGQHSHGRGSYAVSNGQHAHDLPVV